MYRAEVPLHRRLLIWAWCALAGALTAGHAEAAGLITAVSLTAEGHGHTASRPGPGSICRGEVLEVVVSTRHPQDPRIPVTVAIDGYPGARRFLQFDGEPAERRINIVAHSTDDLTETVTEKIVVDGCTLSEVPSLDSRANPYHPRRVDFRVTVPSALGPDFTGYYWDFGDGTTGFSPKSYVSHDYSAAIDGREPFHSFLVQLATQPFVGGQAPAGTLVRRYAVAVGDNYYFSKQQGILQPPVVHDPVMELRGEQLVGFYSIRNLEPHHIVFEHVTQETFSCAPEGGSIRKTVLPSDVIFQGGLDLEDPSEVESPSYQLALQIKDSIGWLPEDTEVIPPVYDPDHPPAYVGGKSGARGPGLDRTTAAAETTAAEPIFPPIPPPTGPRSGFVVLPAEHTHEGFITLDARDFDPSICNVAFHLVGETTEGERVYASLYYELRENPALSGELADQRFAAFLSDLMRRGWLTDPALITDEDLYRLEQEGKIRRTLAGWEVI